MQLTNVTRKRLKLAARRAGFTLIEMVVVITILVILTGMVISKLDVFEMKAQKGVAATNMADVFRNIENYRVLVSVYPDNWDSLLDASGALPTSAPATTTTPWTPGLHGELTGGPPFAGSPIELAVGTLDPNEVVSLGREGITNLYDFPGTGTAASWQAWGAIPGDMAGQGAGTARNITGSTTAKVARLNVSGTLGQTTATTFTIATDAHNKADTIAASIYKTPADPATGAARVTVPANKNLVVLGFGPLNQSVGSTTQNSLMTEAPFYPNEDQQHLYNRFLAVFETDITGSRARLVAVLGADGDRMYDEVADFYAQNP